MPFKSKSQRRWMYANKPRMAKKWEKHTPDDADLPEKKDKEAELADGQGIDMFTKKQAEAASDQAFLALRAYDRHTSGRKFAQELKKARTELGVDRNTIQALDLAEARSRDPSELRARGFAKAADQWLEKTAAPAWAKKLMKKRESDGKDVPEWLKKMTGNKKEQKEAMEKLALTGRLISGLGRRMVRGSKALSGALSGLSGATGRLSQRFGRRLGRMGGHLEAAGGLRRQIPSQIARLARRVPGVAPVEAGVRRAAGFGRRAAGVPAGAFRRMRNLFRRAPEATGDIAGYITDASAGGAAGGAVGRVARRTRFPLGVGQAVRYGVPAGLGFGLGAHLYGGPRESAEQQVTMDEDQPDFVKKMMGGLGQYVGEDLGLESLGNMIRQNPYSSLGVGVGGGGLLLYLLYQLLSRRMSGNQAYVPGFR